MPISVTTSATCSIGVRSYTIFSRRSLDTRWHQVSPSDEPTRPLRTANVLLVIPPIRQGLLRRHGLGTAAGTRTGTSTGTSTSSSGLGRRPQRRVGWWAAVLCQQQGIRVTELVVDNGVDLDALRELATARSG